MKLILKQIEDIALHAKRRRGEEIGGGGGGTKNHNFPISKCIFMLFAHKFYNSLQSDNFIDSNYVVLLVYRSKRHGKKGIGKDLKPRVADY